MLFRRCASIVDAVHLDGSDAAIRAVFAIPRAAPTLRAGGLEVSTAGGRRLAHRGTWVTRDIATQAIRLYDEGLFQARHEPLQ